MDLINIKDIEKFLTCPHKLNFEEQSTTISNFEQAKLYIFEQLSRYYYGKLCLGRSLTSKLLNNKLNRLWDLAKVKFKLKRQPPTDLIYISKRVQRLYEIIREDETLIAFDYLVSCSVRNYKISGNLHAVIYNENSRSIKGIWNTNIIPPPSESKNYYYFRLISLLFYKCLYSDFYRHVNKFHITCYNVYSGSIYSYDLFPDNINDLIEGICKNFTNKNYYPTPGNICDYCMYNKTCEWYK
jgi:uncharacterized C2H2 Zn-finger protein